MCGNKQLCEFTLRVVSPTHIVIFSKKNSYHIISVFLRSNVDNSSWLEVGVVNFGPIIVESAISSDVKAQNLYNTQKKFLKMHDEKHKKLWFLWPELSKTSGKCGCMGGCVFFGNNKNGARFFKPNKKDLEDGVNIAAFR